MPSLACPRCHHPLSTSDVPSLALLACTACGGAWVDAAGCGALAADARPEVATHARELAEGARVAVEVEAPVACPVCAEPMSRHLLPGPAIALDRCAEHGTWFDPGELRAVAFLAEGARVEALPFGHPAKPPSGWGAAASTVTGTLDLVFALARIF